MTTYLVTCATGRQGGATVKHLLKAGAQVHAVVRNPESSVAQSLREQGVVLFKGDNDNAGVITKAAEGCRGVFLVPQHQDSDHDAEVRQIRTIVQASVAAGIENVVLSSAIATGDREKWNGEDQRKLGLPDYYAPKAAAEAAIKHPLIQSWTILRPSWFYANYLIPAVHDYQPGLRERGELVHALDDGVRVAHIDVDDIGKFAAAALLDPSTYGFETIELGSENLSPEDAANALSEVSGLDIKVRKRSPEEITEAQHRVRSQKFQLYANRFSLSLDCEALRAKYGLRLTSFKEYLQREKDLLLATLNFGHEQKVLVD
ncbi:hypothetical protein PFICI_03863 [Pestalotiopsis fici W106-1]|uniref:NmrA-like domain-containing protein n=1 Tax=Pestalotiopsis fici (strain W106-1 / CGMCC3.15140) TaxID=1229662 RepID=W3XIE2_PESFW|nr:uncharacterized protein PFICI_03863 [Pestalotiopsis fici W106-1]ETS85838.1 hypothetical protein PFICI_03863 [Pestalotiopsis fici W106-1]